jgi:transposase InsO family protein
MLGELSVVEQRYLAVREVLDSGASVTNVARRYGVDRRTLHRWLVCYANEGLSALADHSSKPDRCPHQTSPQVEALIVSMRRAHPSWGPRTILSKLRSQVEQPPSRSAIYRCLVRHRLIEPKPRRRTAKDYRRWERSRAMELWQLDVMGGVHLSDGTSLSVVTGIDDHSRFCVLAKLVVRATAQPVCDALLEALASYGPPESILTDNGRVFTGKLSHRPAVVMFDRICNNNGIRHLLTAPYSPTTTGKIERLHKTMRKEFFSLYCFETIEAYQAALDRWVHSYNTLREHQAIGDVAPIRRFELRPKPSLEVVAGELESPPPEPPPQRGRQAGRPEGPDQDLETLLSRRGASGRGGSPNGPPVKAIKPARPTKGGEVLRKVDPSGGVSFAGTNYRVDNRYKRQLVGVRLAGDTVQITFEGNLVRTHKARHDKAKEFGALAQPDGKPRWPQSVA